jgi:hypothetical protein
MSPNKWILPIGLSVAFILLLIPPILMAPTQTLYYSSPEQPITGPQAETGVSQQLTWWNLLLAGLAVGASIGIGAVGALLRKGFDADASPRLKLLVIVGIITLTIYVLAFLLPYPLTRYYNFKGISFGVIAQRDPAVALSLTAATVGLFLLYYVAYRLCRGRNDRYLWMAVVVGAVLFAMVTTFVALVTSLDIYDYIARGRITGVHRGNPYFWTPSQYPGDPFMEYASWKDNTAAYGPVWEVLSGFVSRVSGDSLWLNMIIHKGIALACYLACVLIVAALLQRVAPKRALSGTLLFAWNPLILLEGVANGHNDLLLMAFILGGLWALSQAESFGESESNDLLRRWTFGALGIVLLWLAVLVKFVPILLVPFFFLYLLSKEKSWRDRLGLGFFLLALIALVTFQYYRYFWQWPEVSYTFTRRGEMFRMSIPSVILAKMKQDMENLPFLRNIADLAAGLYQSLGIQPSDPTKQIGPLEVAQAIAGWPFLAVFAPAYLVVLTRTAYAFFKTPRQEKSPTPQNFRGKLHRFLLEPQSASEKNPWQILLETSFNVFMLYLLLANFWFWPWYLIWPVALVALVSNKRLLIPLILASCAGELSHVGWNFVWYWWGVSWPTLYRMEEIVVIAMYAPALVWYLLANYTKTRAKPGSREQLDASPETP